MAVALADKLDTLAGIFAIGQKPSGTKDPFGLRRAAIGALRILVEKKLDLDLRALVDARRCNCSRCTNADASTTELWDYMVERLRAYFLDPAAAGQSRASPPRCSTPCAPATRCRRVDFGARLEALVKFLALPEAASLTAANKRIANILKKADGGGAGTVDVDRCCASRPRRRCTKRSPRWSRTSSGRSPSATTRRR